MNWYKKALKQIDNYYEVGYDRNGKSTSCALWAWIDGKFLIHKDCDAIHEDVWPELEDNDYRGRFELDENGWKNVSVVNPKQGQDFPQPLYRLLYDNFGDDIRIVEF